MRKDAGVTPRESCTGLHQVGEFIPQERQGQLLGRHRLRLGQVGKGRGAPGMQMDADFGPVEVPPAGQDPAGRRVPGHPVAHQQGQGEAEFPGDELQAAQFGDVGHPGFPGIVAGK